MSTVQVDQENTSGWKISISWAALVAPNDGGSPITSYHVQWDEDGENFTDLFSSEIEFLDLAFVVLKTTHNLQAGQAYRFRYRAKNVFGWGEYSDPASYLAAAIPLTAKSVVTSIQNLYVKIAWEEPDTQESAIEEY